MRVRFTVMAKAGFPPATSMIRVLLAVRMTGVFAFRSRSCRRSDRRSTARWDTFPPCMRIGVPKETAAGEHRVALVPEVVSKLGAKGLDVLVQSGAGADALLSDAAFVEAGAQIIGTPEHPDAADVWGADLVVKIAPPDAEEIRGLGAGSMPDCF